MPKRTRNHVLEQLSRDELSRLLVGPLGWVVRDITLDYGIDVEVEIFDPDGSTTGLTFKVQLKGMEKPDHIGPWRDIKVDHLRYWNRLDVPVLLVAYDDSSNEVYGRWVHTLDPPLKPDQKQVRIRFSEGDRIAPGDDRLREIVEIVRAVKTGAYGRPYPVAIIGPGNPQRLEHDFFESVRRADLGGYFRLGRDSQAFSIDLSELEVRVVLPAEVGSISSPYSTPAVPERRADDALVLFAALIAHMNRFGEAILIVNRAGAASGVDANPQLAVEFAIACYELRDEESLLKLLIRALDRGHLGAAEIYLHTLRQVASRARFATASKELDGKLQSRVQDSIDSHQPHVAARWAYSYAQLVYELGDRQDAAAWVERAILLNPEGYGQRPEPQKLLGGIAWFADEFEGATRAYQRAVDLGGIDAAGSQLADSLMHAGRFADGLEVIREVLEEGSKNWRDIFVEATLSEIVEELGVQSQQRRLSPPEGTKLTGLSAEELVHHLVAGDALGGAVWLALSRERAPTRITEIAAAAFVSGDPGLFALAVLAGLHEPAADLMARFARLLHDEPEVRQCLVDLAETDVPGVHSDAVAELISRSFEIAETPPGVTFVSEFNIPIDDADSEMNIEST